ncbi:host attachment protein [Shinella yambaruensis]|nr:host attachment protein [Shinella yambaruensis]MCJ8025194.1 host attachment protein [Shinella yambaruensis]MCU7981174.1 host attachment protein [Shinella yambaruensis]
MTGINAVCRRIVKMETVSGGGFMRRDRLQARAKPMRTNRTWILIADGSRGRIIRQLRPDAETGNRLDDLIFEIDHKKLGEIMTDRPGRSITAKGTRRSAMEYHSQPVQEQEARFAGMMLDTLMRAYGAQEFDRVVVVAEPRMLGAIRLRLPPMLRRAVVKEIAKDLTKLPPQDLYRALEADVGRHGAG